MQVQNVYIEFLSEVGVFINCLERSSIVYLLNSGSFGMGSK